MDLDDVNTCMDQVLEVGQLHQVLVRSNSRKGEIRTARSADPVSERDHSLDDLDSLKWIGSSDS